jgi:hypothetical protein
MTDDDWTMGDLSVPVGNSGGAIRDVPGDDLGWVPPLAQCLRDGVGTFFRKGARAEDGYAHATDLTGMCYREVWANRNHKAEEEWDYTSMVRMDLGTALEPWLLERLETGFIEQNFRIDHQVRLSVWMEGPTLTGGLRILEPQDGRPIVRGTLDAMYTSLTNFDQRFVHDVKTGATVNEKYGYRLQTSLYGLAVKASAVGLIYFSRMDGKLYSPEPWDPEIYREELTQRFKQVTMFTKPGDPEPTTFVPNPWTYVTTKTGKHSWACGKPGGKPSYCNYLDCERNNRNPRNQ